MSERSRAGPLGFLLTTAGSRRVPWARTARVPHLGDPYLADRADQVVSLIRRAASRVGRVMRVDVRVFNRDASIREAFEGALRAEGFRPSSRHRMYRLTSAVPLLLTPDELFRRLPKGARSRIREPLKAGLVVGSSARQADVTRLIDLMEQAFSRTAGRFDAESAREDLCLAIAQPRHRPLATLERLDVQGPERIVAFSLGAANGDHVTYVHGAADREGGFGSLSLTSAPVWELLRWAAEHGARWFDLGGISASADPSHPLAGITQFKRRFGGHDLEVASELELVLNGANSRLEQWVGGVLAR